MLYVNVSDTSEQPEEDRERTLQLDIATWKPSPCSLQSIAPVYHSTLRLCSLYIISTPSLEPSQTPSHRCAPKEKAVPDLRSSPQRSSAEKTPPFFSTSSRIW